MLSDKRRIIASAIQITTVDGEKWATVEEMATLLDVAGARGADDPSRPPVGAGRAARAQSAP